MSKHFQRIRKAKYFFYRYGIHRLLPSSAKLQFAGNLSSLSRWIAKNKDLPFTDFPSKTFDHNRRFELHEHVVKEVLDSQAIDYLEFGVFKGNSFRWWVDRVKDPEARFYGFDTFTGLPEDWGIYKAGDMNSGNAPPEIDDDRHQFYQGIFQATLPRFLKQFDGSRQKVIHLDADLFSSTLYVLTSISPFLKSGDIILFDEFNVPMHEYRAFMSWKESYMINYKVLGSVNNFYQTAIQIS